MIVQKEVQMPTETRIDLLDRTLDPEYYRKYPYGRRDILLVQVWDVCNIFIYVDGYIDIQLWMGVSVNNEEKAILQGIGEQAYKALDPEYITKHKKFFTNLNRTLR